MQRHEHTRIHSFTWHAEANAQPYECLCERVHVCTWIYVCVFHLFAIDTCMIKAVCGKWSAIYWSLFPDPLVSYWVVTESSANKQHSLTQIHTHTHTMSLLIRHTCTVSLYENALYPFVQNINRLMPYQFMWKKQGISCTEVHIACTHTKTCTVSLYENAPYRRMQHVPIHTSVPIHVEKYRDIMQIACTHAKTWEYEHTTFGITRRNFTPTACMAPATRPEAGLRDRITHMRAGACVNTRARAAPCDRIHTNA